MYRSLEFASVSALEAVQGQIVVGGAFQYVIANPSDRAWELHTDKVSQGELLTAQELAEINAVRRNLVAAITINGQQLTGFSPSIGDNNLGVDEIAQIRDVVSDGQGNIFVCGDWWVTAPTGNQFWQTFNSDAGESNPNNSSWEGQTSQHQPRPNQHNVGKFNLTNGNSAIVGGQIWGATTDGGVQACDYEPETDTLIIGGHYDRIGPYDANYVDTATPENNYPAGHLALRKVNAIDAATGRLLEWDPGVTTFRLSLIHI